MNKESFLVHLEALRRMVLEILVIFVLILVPCWFFAPDILDWLQKIAGRIAAENNAGTFELHYITLMEPFLVELKVAMLLAFAWGLPLYFWRFWHFIAPALYRREKRFLLYGAIAAWLLFGCGAALALGGVMPLLVKFSLSFARNSLMPFITLDNFTGLMINIVLAFGLMFELPLLVLALAAVGVIRIDLLARQRPVAAVVILVLAALLTPPDVISQLMLGLPVYLLFELTILLGRVLIRQTAADDPGGDNTAANHSAEDTTASTVDDLTDCENDFMSNCYVRRKKIRIRRPEKFMPRKTGKHIDGRW